MSAFREGAAVTCPRVDLQRFEPTHATTFNNRSSGELLDDIRPHRDQIRRELGLLDGQDEFSWSLWKLPDDVEFPDVDLSVWPREYMQSAGSADRMVIEMRVFDADSEPHQLSIGRGGSREEDPAEPVVYGSYTLRVHPDEIFTADEATEVYYSYFQTGDIPAGFVTRELDIS
ncbi:hypothetical protein MN032_16075 [Agromyces atrinae]|uniref:hypothetical protein n=1 Tax=Agromyces atrinae TaxID=592376 RepID=UPI001F55F7FD|nr:hypothetical protein [Agromyces atrinae]MCI2959207.1 hypothetical protein [Agromyces atrinae]